MGNQPSSTNHNKLSKPKTNTNSAIGAAKVDSPQSITADLSPEGRQQIKDALLSPTATEFDPSTWMHQDDSLGEIAKTRGRASTVVSRSNSRANSRTNSRSNSLSCFGNKQASTAQLAGLADSKMSLASVSHVDIAEAIRLLQQVKKNATPEELAALQEVLEAPEEPAQPVAEASVSRRASLVDRSSSSLTRRQSLIQTPGVGTRHSPVEGRRRTWNSWKAPKLDPEEEAKWQSKPKGNSHLAPPTVLRLSDEAREPTTARAVTPSELDYAHLGSLKLGSLVVTNGAVSPVLSAKAPEGQKAGDDDYFSATEPNSSPLIMKSTRRRAHTRSKSAAVPMPSPLYELEANEMPTPGAPEITTNAVADESSKFLQQAHQDKQNASQIAESYQADIPFSPFFASEETAMFYRPENSDSADMMESPRSVREPVVEEPKSQPEVKVSKPSATSNMSTAQKPKSKANQRPPPRTTDSGYSSGGSLRRNDRAQLENDTSILCHRCSESPQMVDASQEQGTRRSVLAKKSHQEADSSPASSDSDGHSPIGATRHAQMARHAPALNSPVLSTSSSGRSSASESLKSPKTPRYIGSRASLDSASSKQQKRFHKRRQSQPEHLVVQSCQPIPEGTIPEVPTKVRVKFEQRVSNTPGIDYLTHTYPTKEHVVADEPAADASATDPTEFNQLTELEPERPPTPPVHSRRRSLSFFRRRSSSGKVSQVEKEPEHAALGVVHLGTITSSLGNSPYDIAVPDNRRESVISPTHPHQLGSSLPRSKSMVSMDNKAAAEFARLHSQDLSAAGQNRPSQQRRKSCHSLHKEAGEATVSKLRPQSVDVPPVPSIDTSRLSVPKPVKPQGPRAAPGTGPRSHRVSQSVGRFDGPPQRLSQLPANWETHSQIWKQRRRTLGDRLYSDVNLDMGSESDLTAVNVTPVETTPQRTPQTTPPKQVQAPNNMSKWDRFSGGLEYNYERGAGIGGSAGTRSLHSHASVKSLHFQHQYGVDLSDVPIMIHYQT
ncbi:hypothetical protein ACET3X_008358 [Alternaria dauci]|uniref:Uncharacterized protein n=1 Tax=Alternaria dauci TaxID=48095 RepID=A0ABR3UA48_9PLEO